MEILTLFTTAFIVGLSGALMPGPLTTFSITESVKRGWHAAPTLVAGHSIAELVVVIALAVGLSRLLNQTLVIGSIGVLGGAFLIWMGFDMVKGILSGSVKLDLQRAPVEARPLTGEGVVAVRQDGGVLASGLVGTGILISISNPYWLVWWATVGAEFVSRSLQAGAVGLAAFYLGHILSDFGWNGLLGGIAHSGRRVINNTVYGAVIAVCGVFICFLGAYFLYAGVQHFLG